MAKKILIIEDEKSLIKNLELALGEDYQVLSSSTGQEGIKIAQEDKPDLILLDFMLPDMEGSDILKELKSNEKTDDIPVIVLTNRSDQETVSKIFEAGGKEYLIKADWSIDDIVKKIEVSL